MKEKLQALLAKYPNGRIPFTEIVTIITPEAWKEDAVRRMLLAFKMPPSQQEWDKAVDELRRLLRERGLSLVEIMGYADGKSYVTVSSASVVFAPIEKAIIGRLKAAMPG